MFTFPSLLWDFQIGFLVLAGFAAIRGHIKLRQAKRLIQEGDTRRARLARIAAAVFLSSSVIFFAFALIVMPLLTQYVSLW